MQPVFLCMYECSVCSDLQVQVHPARPANMFGFGETVFVGCQARGCAAPGRSLALYRCVYCACGCTVAAVYIQKVCCLLDCRGDTILCTQEWTEPRLL